MENFGLNPYCLEWYHRGTIELYAEFYHSVPALRAFLRRAFDTTMRYQKVIKHGNALAVVIPAAICRELGVHRGDYVSVIVLNRAEEKGGYDGLYLEITPVKEASIPANL